MENAGLYLLTSFIWGSTWLAIKYQLGVVAPEVSIVYRFALAAVILGVYVLLRRLPMRFSIREHGFIALYPAAWWR
jgi:drug/metabolite transporter (DMT)-like permease